MKAGTLGIITYQSPHLKTEQVLHRLLARSDPPPMRIYALPFLRRPSREPVFQHRPDQASAAAPGEIARKHGIPYLAVSSDLEINEGCDVYLLLGAGILSPECVAGKKIINCHPGVLPTTRGLDAFKWAVYEMSPLGVTLHYIDREVDAGEVISIVFTSVYASDSIDVLARRHYENEIDVLSSYDRLIGEAKNPSLELPSAIPKKRMPRSLELETKRRFATYRSHYCET